MSFTPTTWMSSGLSLLQTLGVVWAWTATCVFALSADPAVWMDRVEGRWTGTQAELTWSTMSARDVIGFHVYRVDNIGPILLNEQLILADVFQPAGAEYCLIDPQQAEGAAAAYRIDAVTVEGSVETVGTWTVRFAASKPVSMASAALPAVLADATPDVGPALKVPVMSNDLYRVSFADIAAGLGWSENAVSNAVAQTNLSMRCGQLPVAYLPDMSGQQVVFYGWPATNRYTRTHYFWIEPGVGLHMQETAPGSIVAGTNLSFASSVHFEEDKGSMVEFGLLRGDLYYWEFVQAGHASIGTRAFDVSMDGYKSGDAEFTVNLIGYDDSPSVSDHLAEIWFNTNKIGEMAFDGKEDVSAIFTAAEATILPSGNQLKVTGILQPGVIVSRFVIDGFEVNYDRFYEPFGGMLQANDGGHGRLSADAFSDPLVLDVTDPFIPVWIATTNGVIPPGWSWAAGTNTQWAISAWSRVPSAAPEPAGFGPWLRDDTNRVDYLVIAPRAFALPARELADYRATQGLRTAVAVYEDICDHFADGLNTPEAIRECLSYAHQNWESAPWLVCLGGWGHYDYLGVQTAVTSYLPALLGSDSTYLRPADGLLADISGNDGVPDLAIGRLPVQSEAQFTNYIAKLKAYEADGLQSGQVQMQFIADDADAGGDFAATNLELAEETSAGYTNSFAALQANATNLAAVQASIDDAFSVGSGIIHYTGHGSYKQLASENLFDSAEAAGLTFDPIPLFVSLTCIVGRYDIYLPSQRCLAEELLMNPAGGSLAVFAPSGLSWNYYAALFADELYRLHAEGGADLLGSVLLKARQSFGSLSGLHADAIRTYNLLGDPALKLRGGEGGTPPAWVQTYEHWRWEKFDYSELSSPDTLGSSNLLEYAFGGYAAQLAMEAGTGSTATVSWNQRMSAGDLSYRLRVSTNLVSGSWEDAPPGMTVVTTPLGDGVMERVDADVPLANDNLFMRMDVIKP